MPACRLCTVAAAADLELFPCPPLCAAPPKFHHRRKPARGKVHGRVPAKRVPTKHVGAGALTRPQHAAPNMIYHPTFCPLFCSSSHLFSGAKYSSSAPPSIFRSPVITSNASGHGLLSPFPHLVLNFAPASLEPKKVQRCSGPVYPEAWQSAR